MGFLAMQHFPWAGICFLVFLLVCSILVGVVSLQVGLMLSGQDTILVLTLLPLTAYLPVVIGVHVLSRANFFPTVALWIMGTLTSFILAFLQNLMTKGVGPLPLR